MALKYFIRRSIGSNRLTVLEGHGLLSRLTSAAMAEKYMLVKTGADEDHIAICGAADSPLGIAQGTAAAAEATISIALLTSGAALPRYMVASAAIVYGALLEPAANGRVQTLTATPGTHHVVGRALSASAGAGDVIEVAPFYFLRVI